MMRRPITKAEGLRRLDELALRVGRQVGPINQSYAFEFHDILDGLKEANVDVSSFIIETYEFERQAESAPYRLRSGGVKDPGERVVNSQLVASRIEACIAYLKSVE
jgi:hypothetical protein